jgi:DNA-binding transcriptional ArsR family regulator
MKTELALAALAGLAQRKRLDIFRHLVEAGPAGAAVGSIGKALDIPAATLSFHLKELSHAGLVASRQDGRFIWYSANFAAMNGLIEYLTENCCAGQPELCTPACKPATARRKKRVSA